MRNAFSNADSDGYGYCNCYRDGYGDSDSYGNANGDSYANRNANTKASSNTKASPNTAAASVTGNPASKNLIRKAGTQESRNGISEIERITARVAASDSGS